MTLRTNARVADFTYWIYFAAGIGGLMLAGNVPATAVEIYFAVGSTVFCWLLRGRMIVAKGATVPVRRQSA